MEPELGEQLSMSMFANKKELLKEKTIQYLNSLSDEERLDIFHNYCLSCGSIQKTFRCQCWNDE